MPSLENCTTLKHKSKQSGAKVSQPHSYIHVHVHVHVYSSPHTAQDDVSTEAHNGQLFPTHKTTTITKTHNSRLIYHELKGITK